MNLLIIFTFIVGPVDTWPTDVISAILLEEHSLASIKTVAAFFYGKVFHSSWRISFLFVQLSRALDDHPFHATPL